MAVTLTSTGITFSDGTTQTTKAEASSPVSQWIGGGGSSGTVPIPSTVDKIWLSASGGGGGGNRQYSDWYNYGGGAGWVNDYIIPVSTGTISYSAGNAGSGSPGGNYAKGSAGGSTTISGAGLNITLGGGGTGGGGHNYSHGGGGTASGVPSGTFGSYGNGPSGGDAGNTSYGCPNSTTGCSWDSTPSVPSFGSAYGSGGPRNYSGKPGYVYIRYIGQNKGINYEILL